MPALEENLEYRNDQANKLLNKSVSGHTDYEHLSGSLAQQIALMLEFEKNYIIEFEKYLEKIGLFGLSGLFSSLIAFVKSLFPTFGQKSLNQNAIDEQNQKLIAANKDSKFLADLKAMFEKLMQDLPKFFENLKIIETNLVKFTEIANNVLKTVAAERNFEIKKDISIEDSCKITKNIVYAAQFSNSHNFITFKETNSIREAINIYAQAFGFSSSYEMPLDLHNDISVALHKLSSKEELINSVLEFTKAFDNVKNFMQRATEFNSDCKKFGLSLENSDIKPTFQAILK